MKFTNVFFLALAAVPAFSIPLHARSGAPVTSSTMSAPNATMSAPHATMPAANATMSAPHATMPAVNATMSAPHATMAAANATMTTPHASMTAPNATMTAHPTAVTNGTMVNTTAIALELNAALGQLVNAINALEGTNGTSTNMTKVARRAMVAALSDTLDGSNDLHLELRRQLWSTYAEIIGAERGHQAKKS